MGTNICKAFFIIALLANLTNASIFVEYIGLGQSVEVAKKDAISNGIREAVGEYVRTKQTLENENLNEQILNFSNAYLLEYKQLSVNKLPNGLYELKAKLEIEDGKLVGVLKDLQVDVKNVDNGTFKVYVDEKYKQLQRFRMLFDEMVLAPLRSGEAYQVKVLNFEPCELSKKKDRTCENGQYIISFIMDYQKGYLDGIARLLKAAGAQPQQCTDRNKQRNEVKILLGNKCLLLSDKFGAQIVRPIHDSYFSWAVLELSLLDSNKEIIKTFFPNFRNRGYGGNVEISHYSDTTDLPTLNGRTDECQAISMRHPRTVRFYHTENCISRELLLSDIDMIFVQTNQVFAYYAKLSPNEIARIKEIKISFSPRSK